MASATYGAPRADRAAAALGGDLSPLGRLSRGSDGESAQATIRELIRRGEARVLPGRGGRVRVVGPGADPPPR